MINSSPDPIKPGTPAPAMQTPVGPGTLAGSRRITLVAGPQEVDLEQLRNLVAAAGGNPESITADRVEPYLAQSARVLSQLAADPSLLARLMADPRETLERLGLEPFSEAQPILVTDQVMVESSRHSAAVGQLQQQVLALLSRDTIWADAFRTDSLAAIITIGSDQPATVTAEVIRRLTQPVDAGKQQFSSVGTAELIKTLDRNESARKS